MAESSTSAETVKYLIYIKFTIAGIVEKSDVIGAIFGQTEGLLGDSLDLRDLQRTSRIGRITVNIQYNKAQRKTTGSVVVPSSLDRVETAVLAASLETVDRVGPCVAKIQLQKLEDVRSTKRVQIVSRATQILKTWDQEVSPESSNLVEEVLKQARVSAVSKWGKDNLPAGPAVEESDTLIIVEGRADVLNLLKYGFKNAIAVQGTNIPESIIPLTRKKRTIAFLDGDRGGDLILKELLELAEIDYVARAPPTREVEELTGKEVLKALRNRVPIEQVLKELEADLSSDSREKDFKRDKKQRDKRRSKEKIIEESDIEIIEEEIDSDDGGSKGLIEDLPKDIQNFIKELGESKALIIGSDNKIVHKCEVKELRQALLDTNSKKPLKGVIFDGVITQRLVDVAEKKDLEYVVGVLSSDVKTSKEKLKIMEFRR
jgi:DNA primase